MPADFFDKYTFLCEMYSEERNEILDLILHFFPFDNSIEVVDPSKGKKLVRRVQLPTLKLNMLQVGNIVAIFAKLLYIKDTAPLTARQLFGNQESTFVLIKPTTPDMYGKVITFLLNHGFRIVRMRNGMLDKNITLSLYEEIAGSAMMPIIAEYVRSGEVVGMEVTAPFAVKRFRKILGATDPKDAAPHTLRAIYGQDILRNVAHGCRTHEGAQKMLDLYFGNENGRPRIPYRATCQNCTCCIIKPHVMFDGNLGHIFEMICTSGKYFISAMSMFMISVNNALEFYEVYKNVLPEYEMMSQHLAEGSCLVLEIKSTDKNVDVVNDFRQLCGPRDPDVGRQLYPDTIRAMYGKDVVHNAVHCTDLREDGETECEYFFKILTCENLQ